MKRLEGRKGEKKLQSRATDSLYASSSRPHPVTLEERGGRDDACHGHRQSLQTSLMPWLEKRRTDRRQSRRRTASMGLSSRGAILRRRSRVYESTPERPSRPSSVVRDCVEDRVEPNRTRERGAQERQSRESEAPRAGSSLGWDAEARERIDKSERKRVKSEVGGHFASQRRGEHLSNWPSPPPRPNLPLLLPPPTLSLAPPLSQPFKCLLQPAVLLVRGEDVAALPLPSRMLPLQLATSMVRLPPLSLGCSERVLTSSVDCAYLQPKRQTRFARCVQSTLLNFRLPKNSSPTGQTRTSCSPSKKRTVM